ncbi:MAG: substrate-binding domain-containing protein, partial [Solobacterium sp.]|nr:substrate-binding domain-containing protein [Solobacterium sp.]
LCPVSQDGILPILELCQEKGVKVINYDSPVADRDLVECFIGSDNYSAGQLDAEYLNEKYPDGGAMLIIDNPKAESVVARVKGLTENLNENFEVVNDYNISTLEEVLSGTEDTLQVHPELAFIFGLNDSCGLISLGAVQSAGRDDIVVVSVDGSPDGQASIADGGLMATAAQSPVTIGQEVFAALQKDVAGEELEDVSVPCFLISQENIADYDVTQWH